MGIDLGGQDGWSRQRVQAVAARTRLIDQWLEGGLLTRDGSGYRTEIEYSASGLLLNGRPFDPTAISRLAVDLTATP